MISRMFSRFAAIAMACAMATGCVSVKSFPDPATPVISYDVLHRPEKPLLLRVAVEFQRNGEHLEKVDKTIQDKVERTLRATGVILPSADPSSGEIRIVLNNIADRGTAAAKGFGTGLTFGLVGSTVQDAYEMSVTITANGKTFTRTGLHHSFYTIVGNANPPEGVGTMPPSTALDKVIEQLLLAALKEYQASDMTPSSAAEPWNRMKSFLSRLEGVGLAG